MEEETKSTNKIRRNTNQYFKILIAASLMYYIAYSGSIKEWNPLNWKEAKEHREQVYNFHNHLFENAVDFDDSVKIYQELGFPLKLEEPSFEEKERIVKSLDSSLVE